jgi:hypothetical protein
MYKLKDIKVCKLGPIFNDNALILKVFSRTNKCGEPLWLLKEHARIGDVRLGGMRASNR